MIKMSEEEMLETLTNYNLVNHFNNTKFFEALKCLLNMYNQEKEKNENLNWYFENQKQNFIHKDKIRAKIEELNKTIYKGEIPEFYAIYRYTADVLEELLEE